MRKQIALEYDPADLPDSLVDIVEVIGLESTMKLVARYGGQQIQIPLKLDLFHPLVVLLGVETATKLCWSFPGSRYVPTCERMRARALARAVVKARHRHTISELSEMFGISGRRICQIQKQFLQESVHTSLS